MKNVLIVGFLAMFVVGFCVVGCEEKSDTPVSSVIDTVKDVVSQQLCDKCGQIKGSDVCCAADAEKCPKCGLVKDSPGCLAKIAGTPGISLL